MEEMREIGIASIHGASSRCPANGKFRVLKGSNRAAADSNTAAADSNTDAADSNTDAADSNTDAADSTPMQRHPGRRTTGSAAGARQQVESVG
eukprot:scaffold10612_cov70-Phaeocystis_antarctica.AAC.2